MLAILFVQSLARSPSPLRVALGLPSRPTAAREWALGAAIGWAVALLAVLALLAFRSVQFGFWTAPSAFVLAATTLAGLLATTLAIEITFRGLPFRWLGERIGPAWAAVLLSFLFAIVILPGARQSAAGLLVGLLLGLLLAVAWLRTYALWLSWGLSFALAASLGVLFGVPVAGETSLSSVVQANLDSARQIAGGPAGPEASPLMLVWLLLALVLLVRATRDYAWNYTQPVLRPAGYPMDVAPPPAHAAIKQAAPPPPLVQILPSTPQERSSSTPTR